MFDLRYIKQVAREVGFDLCGVAQHRIFEQDKEFFEGWLDKGYASSLEYLKRNIDVRADSSALLEGAKSVIVCAVSYKNSASEGYPADCSTKVASYACTTDYHTTIKQMLFEMCHLLKEAEPTLSARCFVDSAPLFEKRYAVEAGLGWIGRQSLLVTPQHGTFVLLGEIVTDIEVAEYDTPYEGVGCGECHRCVEACPNRAIKERHIDTSLCISRATIEREDDNTIPLHGWIFGCDECQTVCPYNRKAPLSHNPRLAPLFRPEAMSRTEWLSLSAEEFAQRFSATPLSRSGYERIRKNIQELKIKS